MRTSAVLLAVALAVSRLGAEEPRLNEAEVRDMQNRVEELRGLTFKRNVEVRLLDEAQLRDNLRRMFDEEWPEARARQTERAWKALGLIPGDMDLRGAVLDLMTEAIGGYYDPKTKALFLVRRGGGGADDEGGTDRMITIHELTHALQDQHFDLLSIPTDMRGNDDAVTALQCVMEGDANFVMYEHLMGLSGSSLRGLGDLGFLRGGTEAASPKLAAAPEVLRRGLLFPYREGMEFVHALLKGAKGWDRVDGLYAGLPLSTEQILHPEKFTAATPDTPVLLTLPDLSAALGNGWTLVEDNVAGELITHILLGEFISRKKSPKTLARAAAGWDGDRYAVYGKGGDTALVWLSTWDTAEDAREFAAAAARALRRKQGGEGRADGEGVTRWGDGTLLEHRGLDVLWLESCGPATGAIRMAVWSATGRADLTRIERKPAPPARALVENAFFRLEREPRKAAWRVEEKGAVTTLTWKGLDGAVTFTVVEAPGDEAELLAAEVRKAGAALEGVRRLTLPIDLGDPAPPFAGVSGRDAVLGEVRRGIVILRAGSAGWWRSWRGRGKAGTRRSRSSSAS